MRRWLEGLFLRTVVSGQAIGRAQAETQGCFNPLCTVTSQRHTPSKRAKVIGGFFWLARQVCFAASAEYCHRHFVSLAVEQDEVRNYPLSSWL